MSPIKIAFAIMFGFALLIGVPFTLTFYRNKLPLENVESNKDHDALEGLGERFTDQTADIGDRFRNGDPNAADDLRAAKIRRRDQEAKINNLNYSGCQAERLYHTPGIFGEKYEELVTPGSIFVQVSGGCHAGENIGVFYTDTDVTKEVRLLTVEGAIYPIEPELRPQTRRDLVEKVDKNTFRLGGWTELNVPHAFDRGFYVLLRPPQSQGTQ